MKPLDVYEWLQPLALVNDFAREALEIVENANLIEGYYDLTEDVHRLTDNKFPNQHWKALEVIEDKLSLLDELVDTLDKAGFKGDVDDALQAALDELEYLRTENEALKAPDVKEYDL